MPFYALVSGALTADPLRRQGPKSAFVTATLRDANDDGVTFYSIIAFGSEAERLAELCQGAAVSVSGSGKLTTWLGRNGEDRHGVSVTVAQLVTLAPKAKPVNAAHAPQVRNPRRWRYEQIRPPAAKDPLPDDPLDDLWVEGEL